MALLSFASKCLYVHLHLSKQRILNIFLKTPITLGNVKSRKSYSPSVVYIQMPQNWGVSCLFACLCLNSRKILQEWLSLKSLLHLNSQWIYYLKIISIRAVHHFVFVVTFESKNSLIMQDENQQLHQIN